jgi:hypothetical protein
LGVRRPCQTQNKDCVMRYLILLLTIPLAGCAFNNAYEPPVVDMRGVDQQKYANDLYECTQAKKGAGFVTLGAPISRCLEQRGYKVEIAKS